MGSSIGPPWTKHHKAAAVAATWPSINTVPGAANQRSNCFVHARNSTAGDARMARSEVRRNGLDERSGLATIFVTTSSISGLEWKICPSTVRSRKDPARKKMRSLKSPYPGVNACVLTNC